jgi:hypothetical protein
LNHFLLSRRQRRNDPEQKSRSLILLNAFGRHRLLVRTRLDDFGPETSSVSPYGKR